MPGVFCLLAFRRRFRAQPQRDVAQVRAFAVVSWPATAGTAGDAPGFPR
jgi:hypothetical protein